MQSDQQVRGSLWQSDVVYLVFTFGTDPHAFRNIFEGRVQAVEVVDA